MYTISDEERAAGRLDADKLVGIVNDISAQGYAVVADLVSEETRRLLMTSVLEDAQAIQAKAELTAHEKHTGIGHLQLGLRRRSPYVCADLLVTRPSGPSSYLATLGKKCFTSGIQFSTPTVWDSDQCARGVH